jgi:hypothetical protein
VHCVPGIPRLSHVGLIAGVFEVCFAKFALFWKDATGLGRLAYTREGLAYTQGGLAYTQGGLAYTREGLAYTQEGLAYTWKS